MSEVRELLVASGKQVRTAVERTEQRLWSRPPLVALLLEWAAGMRVTRGMSVNTVASYLEGASQFLAWVIERGSFNPSELPGAVKPVLDFVTLQVIDEWQRELYVKGRLKPAARSQRLTAVRQLFEWLEEREICRNGIRRARGPKKAKKLPVKYSHGDLATLCQSCDRRTKLGRRDYALLMLLGTTGARVSEVAELTLEQLEMGQNVGRVQFFGKGAKERSVSFERPTVEAMMDWLAARDDIPLRDPARVFCSFQRGHYGQPLGRMGILSALLELKKRAGLKCRVHPHKFRVTFATEMYDQGHELEEIRIVLGHEDIETTRGYLAVSERARKARLKGKHVRVMMGEKPAQPLWLRQQLKDGEDAAMK